MYCAQKSEKNYIEGLILLVLTTSIQEIHTHTHTTVLRLCGICPGQPGWAGTRRNIHPLTLIVVINYPNLLSPSTTNHGKIVNSNWCIWLHSSDDLCLMKPFSGSINRQHQSSNKLNSMRWFFHQHTHRMTQLFTYFTDTQCDAHIFHNDSAKCDILGCGDLGSGLRPPSLNSVQDFSTLQLATKFCHPMFNPLEVIMLTNKQNHKQTIGRCWKHPPCFTNHYTTPVGNEWIMREQIIRIVLCLLYFYHG